VTNGMTTCLHLLLQTHDDPDRDKSIADGPNLVLLKDFEGMMQDLMAIDRVVKTSSPASS